MWKLKKLNRQRATGFEVNFNLLPALCIMGYILVVITLFVILLQS